MTTDNIKVFISYSHDSTEHEARVLALADRLRDDGIDALIDQNVDAPPEGWQLWMEKQIDAAQYVLVLCTETYLRRVKKEETLGKGLGVLWEASLMYTHLYEAGVVNKKFIPTVYESGDTNFIPTPLKPTTYYNVSSESGYESLYRRLTDQPATPAAPLGKRRVLAPLPRAPLSTESSSTRSVAPNLVHPYPLQANFTGRLQERAELTAWLRDDAHPIYQLVAMGGMGKSALTWYWLKKDVLPSTPNLDGVMWWSFYEGESSFPQFIDEALKYVKDQPINSDLLATTYDRAQELRKLLQVKRVLFVLDGFERQLRDYTDPDETHKNDVLNESSDARSCIDPSASRLLRDITAGVTRARVLLTTRLAVSNLQDRAGEPLAGTVERELKQLSRDDAIDFMRAQGVRRGTAAEIAEACETYGYHPLSLRLLSGLIKHDPKTPGDVQTAPRHDVSENLIQRQHHVLEFAYLALRKRERALLSRIASFRGSVSYEALEVLRNTGEGVRFEAALENLRVRGLLQHENDRFDLHPIVRRYAYDRLRDKHEIHSKLSLYFKTIVVPRRKNIQSIDEISPLMELYYHTVRAGRYDEAFKLFYERLNELLFYRFRASPLIIRLLTPLLGDDDGIRLKLIGETERGWTLNMLALAYSQTGQPRQALRLWQAGLRIVESRQEKQNLISGLANMATELSALGKLAEAQKHLDRAFKLTADVKRPIVTAPVHQHLGDLFALLGSFDEARKELEITLDLAEGISHMQGQCTTAISQATLALLSDDVDILFEKAQLARKLAEEVSREQYPNELDIIRSEWLLGEALLKKSRLADSAGSQEYTKEAECHLAEALIRCRRTNAISWESHVLIGLARWHRTNNNLESAWTLTQEALQIADRCEYRLMQADIHNLRAQLLSERLDFAGARVEAEIAKERAWCDGPTYCYKPALAEAEKLLKELDVRS